MTRRRVVSVQGILVLLNKIRIQVVHLSKGPLDSVDQGEDVRLSGPMGIAGLRRHKGEE
jgi:hypothetical protein